MTLIPSDGHEIQKLRAKIAAVVNLNAGLCQQAELCARQLNLYRNDRATNNILVETMRLVRKAKAMKP